MENKKKDNKYYDGKSVSKSCRADETFADTLNRVYEQIYIESFSGSEQDQSRELALIIAEVYRLCSTSYIKIDGTQFFAGDVAEVFGMLEKEHIETVIRKNSERTYPVKYRKAYLRTLLYNSVFEYSSANIEDF